ncbi:unnamed protein product [Cochlearia groenlandica]
MALESLVGGAILGLSLQVLHESILRAKDRSLTTRFILNRLEATLRRITPLVVRIDKLSKETKDSRGIVIEDLKKLLDKAVFLIDGYAKLGRRNLRKRYRYQRKIREFEASLRSMLDVDVQLNQWLDIKELAAKMSEMNTKLDEITRQPSDSSLDNYKKNHNISQSTKI